MYIHLCGPYGNRRGNNNAAALRIANETSQLYQLIRLTRSDGPTIARKLPIRNGASNWESAKRGRAGETKRKEGKGTEKGTHNVIFLRSSSQARRLVCT